MFTKVTREQNRLRLALDGPAGSGKTYTALRLGFALAGPTGRVAVIDTEHGSAAKYEGEAPDGIRWTWEGVNLENFAPSTYEQTIDEAGRQGYDVLIIDSLSHAWTGVGGALDQVDRATGKSGNSFTAWRDVTPQHNGMVEAILRSPCHVIATLRSKMEYVMEPNEKGKMIPRKVGLKPIQREGVEYEFDILGDLDLDHLLTVSKSRCSAINGKIVSKPGPEFMIPIREWLTSGSKPAPIVTAPTTNGTKLDATGPRCDPSLAGQIKQLALEAEVPIEKIRGILIEKGIQRLSDLPVADAIALRSKLEEKILRKEGKAAF